MTQIVDGIEVDEEDTFFADDRPNGDAGFAVYRRQRGGRQTVAAYRPNKTQAKRLHSVLNAASQTLRLRAQGVIP